jgi:hypothetical protein
VHQHCLEWARFKRKALFGNEGWPSRSTLGRIIEEGHGASHTQFRNNFPEVMTGIALQVSRALAKMAATHEMERPWLVIHAHYLYPGKARAKADAMRISTPTYWQQVSCAHSYLAGQIEDVEEPTRRASA